MRDLHRNPPQEIWRGTVWCDTVRYRVGGWWGASCSAVSCGVCTLWSDNFFLDVLSKLLMLLLLSVISTIYYLQQR